MFQIEAKPPFEYIPRTLAGEQAATCKASLKQRAWRVLAGRATNVPALEVFSVFPQPLHAKNHLIITDSVVIAVLKGSENVRLLGRAWYWLLWK